MYMSFETNFSRAISRLSTNIFSFRFEFDIQNGHHIVKTVITPATKLRVYAGFKALPVCL